MMPASLELQLAPVCAEIALGDLQDLSPRHGYMFPGAVYPPVSYRDTTTASGVSSTTASQG